MDNNKCKLTLNFVADALKPFEMELGKDLIFRKWNESNDICAMVAITELKGVEKAYTLDICFFSTFICKCFQLPIPDFPTIVSGHAVSFRLDRLLGRKLTSGWAVRNDQQVLEVGMLFRDALALYFPRLFNKFMDINGWISHFREELCVRNRGKGLLWSLLGYSLLSRSTTTYDEINEVIEGHESEVGDNKLAVHLERQRVMVRNRFGRS